MKTEKVLPIAAHVIEKCGGVVRVHELTGRATSSIFKWRWSKSKGGTGGVVPSEAQQELMAAVKRGEVDLTPADFFEQPQEAAE